MHLGPFIRAIKDYASQELIGVAVAFLGRNFFKKKSEEKDAEKASSERAMFLTPDGWQTDKRRLDSDAPIQPV